MSGEDVVRWCGRGFTEVDYLNIKIYYLCEREEDHRGPCECRLAQQARIRRESVVR